MFLNALIFLGEEEGLGILAPLHFIIFARLYVSALNLPFLFAVIVPHEHELAPRRNLDFQLLARSGEQFSNSRGGGEKAV